MITTDRLREYAGKGRLSVLLTGNFDPADLPDIARRVTCAAGGDPSCTCPSCRIKAGHPDVDWLNASAKIDAVREAIGKGDIRPSVGRVRCLVFENIDRASAEIENLLLKRLEEDQDRQYMILTAANPADVLATIKSRCAVFSFPAFSRQAFDAWCRQKGYSEGLYDLTGGFRSRAELAHKNADYLRQAQAVIRKGNERELLEFFGEMKENDRNEFISVHKDVTELVVRLFAEELWRTSATEEQVLLVDDIGDLARTGRVVKNDWLRFLVDWCLLKEEKEKGGAA